MFRIGNSKILEKDESQQFIFRSTLLEDQYVFKVKGTNGGSPEDWRLAPCKCQLVDCLLGGLTLTEKVSAESLNALFSQTVMFYFNMQHSGSANVFDTFFEYDPTKRISFEEIKAKQYNSLGKLRTKLISGK